MEIKSVYKSADVKDNNTTNNNYYAILNKIKLLLGYLDDKELSEIEDYIKKLRSQAVTSR